MVSRVDTNKHNLIVLSGHPEGGFEQILLFLFALVVCDVVARRVKARFVYVWVCVACLGGFGCPRQCADFALAVAPAVFLLVLSCLWVSRDLCRCTESTCVSSRCSHLRPCSKHDPRWEDSLDAPRQADIDPCVLNGDAHLVVWYPYDEKHET
jgi:hypothetical protein